MAARVPAPAARAIFPGPITRSSSWSAPRGSERLRITPTPYHDDILIDALAEAPVDVWERLGLPLDIGHSPQSNSQEPPTLLLSTFSR